MTGKPRRGRSIVTVDPVELSSRVIDGEVPDEALNRVTQQVHEITDGVSIVESFSHVISFAGDDGLVCFDTSAPHNAGKVLRSLRRWSSDPVRLIVYTHGHLDHVGGSGAFAAEAEANGSGSPVVVGHEAIAARFRRYRLTDGYNHDINRRQFGGVSARHGLGVDASGAPAARRGRFLPDSVLWPTREFARDLTIEVGGLTFEMHHAKGETDDHLWAWVPRHRALCVGDLVTWVFPNCGNPQKAQRYPLEWAAALRTMQGYGAEWLFGAHGLPIQGPQRVNRVLDDLAGTLESLTQRTLELMNAGETLDTILHSVKVPEDLLARPWMQPVYDEPEFVVRNLWRLYGGWWDKNPANLKPAPQSVFASEIAALAGGAGALTARARALADAGDLRLACQLVELAVQAEPGSVDVHGARAEIYRARRHAEHSLMSKGIFAAAANESMAAANESMAGAGRNPEGATPVA